MKKVLINENSNKKEATINLSSQNKELIFEIENSKNDTNTYFYKLENFDNQWIKAKYPTFRYTNLEGGDYHFLWKTNNQSQKTILIKKEKSLTEEWWFLPSLIFYVVLLISAAIYFFMLYNLRQKVKLQAIRNRIATDLHDEVGATLNSIAIFSRLAEKKTDKTNIEVLDFLNKIKIDSEETVHTIRDTVWAINPDNDSTEQLFEKMRSMAFQLFTPNEILLDFQNEIAKNKSLKISMEQRRNIYLIFKETINNIIKHAAATEVKISISKKSNEILLSIEDNGCGFDENKIHEGNGLKNYQKRANEGFLSVSMHSEIGKGTKIKIIIPEI